MDLRVTYEKSDLHDEWESVYRCYPIQDNFKNRMMDRIIKYPEPPANALVLGAGCGGAYHSVEIAKRRYRFIVIDISQNILKKARGGHLKLWS